MRAARAGILSVAVVAACVTSDENERVERDASVGQATDDEGGNKPTEKGLTFRADVEPVRSVEEAQEGVFVPPYRSCEPPQDGRPGAGPDGKVCTNVAISGATEPGRYFPDYASCDVVITQRPFWSAPPKRTTPPNDPRLSDQAYLGELAWAKEQIAATGCVCCHDSKSLGKQASQWDIRAEPIWLDSLSDTGLALFAGLADSSVLGAYHAEDNNGFDRSIVGIPSTDSARMQRFMKAELTRRGISEAQARAVPPFGGPIYDQQVTPPTACKAGEGVTKDGRITWLRGPARYVYVLAEGSDNPGVPPNLDLPEGTLFRLDVLASADPIASGLKYGTTPKGSFQTYPERTAAAPLELGKTYQLSVLRDVGLPLANCLFTFGEEPPPAPIDAGSDASTPSGDAGAASGDAGGACTLAGGDAQGFGATCTQASDCTCAADYCALQPGQTKGYCTKTGCKEDASVCPSAYSCFDLSRFAPGQPSFCAR